MIVTFWILASIIVYTYLGYPFLLFTIRIFTPNNPLPDSSEKVLPEVTLLIPAYNEKGVIKQKVENSKKLITLQIN